jgi:hypothetical protein
VDVAGGTTGRTAARATFNGYRHAAGIAVALAGIVSYQHVSRTAISGTYANPEPNHDLLSLLWLLVVSYRMDSLLLAENVPCSAPVCDVSS